jgi:hypothetical protein
MGFPRAIVVMAGILILSGAQAQPFSAGNANVDRAKALPAAPVVAAAGDGACRSGSCIGGVKKPVAEAPVTPKLPSHVLLLAAVGAVAFLARRRHIGN